VARYQRKDAYHQKAKAEGFRSRAAYKLDEFQRAYRLLKPGQRVVDLGCWPGGWLQVASKLVGRQGRVVGVDKAQIEPPLDLANTIALIGDLEEPTVAKGILAALEGGAADVLLSDAAPKLTGIRDTDRANEERLLEAVEALIPQLLRPGGAMILKILEGPEAQAIEKRIRSRFDKKKATRPDSSRKGTTERYLVAQGYRGAPEAES
jgi:23S rRNA (uridine2552-2'-O)-methyltransferase